MDRSRTRILYVDLDNVLADFRSAIPRLDQKTKLSFEEHLDDVPGIFALMDPMPDAVESYRTLAAMYDTYILSTAPWGNPTAWSDKLKWVTLHLGDVAYKRLILTHHKELNLGDYLVDDRTKNGADRFRGELILFGSARFPGWKSVVKHLS